MQESTNCLLESRTFWFVEYMFAVMPFTVESVLSQALVKDKTCRKEAYKPNKLHCVHTAY